MKAARCVRWARLTADLSQRDLAKKTGLPQSTIGRIEAGLVDPRLGTVSRLLRACGYDLEVEPLLGLGIDRTLIAARLALPMAARTAHATEEARQLDLIAKAISKARRRATE